MIFPADLLATKKRALCIIERFQGSGRLVSLLITITVGALPALVVPTVAQAECSNEQLRQNPKVSNFNPAAAEPYDVGLPDCRAYEQVSPTEKDGGSGGVFNFDSPGQEAKSHPMQSLPTASSITYPGEPFDQIQPYLEGHVGIPGTPGERYTFEQQYTSNRSTDSWNTEYGDNLHPEQVPAVALPASVAPNPVNVEESPSGAEVFYIEAGDLYEYKPSFHGTPNPVDLTPNAMAGGAGVQGILGDGGEGTEEGSYVYFVAAGALAAGALPGECKPATEGHANKTEGTGCKLYMYHDGATTFIATLSANDEQGGTLGSTAEDWSGPSRRTAEVSPDGRYVAFDSNYELNRETAEGLKDFPGGPEIFRYSADSRELACVSCLPPTSSDPDGPPLPKGALNLVSTMEGPNGASRQRYMLNNGRVLFDTPNALVTQDTNSQLDVYEWDPVGIGNCTTSSEQFRTLSNGCVALISGGTSEVGESVLADASTDGSDIFFTTSQSLVPQDQDEITDLYDAREEGGFTPPPEPACPVANECPGPIVPPPVLGGTPASATLSGAEAPPSPLPTTKPIPPQTRAQKLAKALKTCHIRRSKRQRTICEAGARKLYGPISHSKKTKRRKAR